MEKFNFKDWLHSFGEDSVTDRWRIGWARGNYPPRADVMSRSTPSPNIMRKAAKELGTPEYPKRKNKDCK